MDQPAVRVDALTVPAQQGADGKGVPKVMQSGRRHARRQTQAEFGNQRVKRLADGFWAYTAAFCKEKQWSIDFTRLAVTFLYIVSEARRQPGPHRHNPALTEFRLANKQRVAVE